jgi:hypothetical protein
MAVVAESGVERRSEGFVMKKTICILLTTGTAYAAAIAGTCLNTTPSLIVESVPVCATIPGLGTSLILPAANFAAMVYFEDMDASYFRTTYGVAGDGDANDAAILVSGDWGAKIITMTWMGGLAMFPNSVRASGGLEYVNQASQGPVMIRPGWEVGQELVLIDLGNVGTQWYSGPAGRNYDLTKHAIVQFASDPLQTVPEPVTFALIGFGLLGLGLGRRGK